MEQVQSAAGLMVLVGLAWAMSSERYLTPWRFVAAALALALALTGFATLAPGALTVLQGASVVVTAIEAASGEASAFIFGHIGGGDTPFEVVRPGAGFSIAFQILPVVIVTAALAAVLDHWGALSAAIRGIGWALRRTIGVSGALGFAAGATFFLGVAEAPLFLRRAFQRMSRADLFAVVVLCLATVSGVVFVLYASTLAPVIPEAVAHILAASAISLPVALAVARIVEPPAEAIASEGDEPDGAEVERRYVNSIDALAQGGLDGMKLFLNIIAVLLVVIASVALLDSILAAAGEIGGQALTVQRIFGWAFAPIAFLIGAPWAEAAEAGALFGTKAILNEFFAYLDLAALPPEALSDRTRLILLYALCGFANLGSIGIILGVLTAIAPDRRVEVAGFAARAWLAGNLATAMTGAMVGIFTPPLP
jgi:CNT family concentrative nucleoside transporter